MGNWWCSECTRLERSAEEQAKRIVKLERMVKDAKIYVVHYNNNVGSTYAHDWLSRYREMFPEAKK